MRKFYQLTIALALAGTIAGPAFAVDRFDGANFDLKRGGKIADRGQLFLGRTPGNVAGIGVPAFAAVALSVGDAVTFAAISITSGVTGYTPMSVTKLASAGAFVVGICLSATTAAGQQTLIQREGVAICNVLVGVTAGDLLVNSATAGGLTASSVVSGTSLTPISRTAVVGIAAETKSAAGFTRVLLER